MVKIYKIGPLKYFFWPHKIFQNPNFQNILLAFGKRLGWVGGVPNEKVKELIQ